MQANSLNERTHLLVEEYSTSGRLDNITQVMSLHTQYLESFLRSQFYMLRMDGPLPLPYRHYIAIMVCIKTTFPNLFVLIFLGSLYIKLNFICIPFGGEKCGFHALVGASFLKNLKSSNPIWNPTSVEIEKKKCVLRWSRLLTAIFWQFVGWSLGLVLLLSSAGLNQQIPPSISASRAGKDGGESFFWPTLLRS